MAVDARRQSGGGDADLRLTRLECDILAGSARGAGLDQVADALGLSRHRVRASLASTMRGLGVRSRLKP